MGARQIERTGGAAWRGYQSTVFLSENSHLFFGSYFTREPQRVSSFATAVSKMYLLSMLQLEYDSKYAQSRIVLKIEGSQNRHLTQVQ